MFFEEIDLKISKQRFYCLQLYMAFTHVKANRERNKYKKGINR
jgi:hypothetical protein